MSVADRLTDRHTDRQTDRDGSRVGPRSTGPQMLGTCSPSKK